MSAAGRVLKIVAVGDPCVGKTCLLIAHTTGVFLNEYVPTVFDNYAGKLVVDEIEYNYTLWDTAGQEEMDRCRVLSYVETSVFLVCFAVDSPSSLDNVRSVWLPEIRRECGERVPVVLVGTKVDLRDSTEAKTIVKKAEGKKLARGLKLNTYLECSAMTLTGCTEVIEAAVRAVVNPQESWKWCPLL